MNPQLSTLSLNDILLVSPMLALLLFSIIPITVKVLNGNREQNPRITLLQGLMGVLVAAALLLVFGGPGKTAFNNVLVFDGVTQWLGIVGLISVGGAMVLMYENPATKGPQFSELIFLTMGSAIGMLILVSAIDLLVIFIGIETMSLALYLMIAMSHEEKLSKEAAFKYFILGSVSSAFYLMGVALVFGSTGTTNILNFIANAADLIETSRLFLFGIGMIVVGFCFKVSIFPFHAWTPDVYQGASTPLTAAMATAVKAVSFAAFLRIAASKIFVGSDQLLTVLQWLAALSMLAGNAAALLQNNLKRMLAYSSIAHSGYILVGLLTAGVSDNGTFGASAVIFYLVSYALMTLGTFAFAHYLEKTENTQVTIDDLNGLASKKPVIALCMSVFLLSLAGIPPFVGFFAKYYLFTAAIGEGFIWLALWGMLNSVIGVAYYLRPLIAMYMKDADSDFKLRHQHATVALLLLSAVLVFSMGLASGPIFSAVEKTLF